MTCETFDELVAAFALSALEPDELKVSQRHLATCRRHDEALASYGKTAERLAFIPDELEPPARLRGRLLDAFDAEVASSGALSATMERRPSGVGVVRRLVRRSSVPYLAAAVLLLAALGLLGWNLALQFGGSGNDQTITVTLKGPGGTGELVYSRQSHIGAMKLDLSPLAPGRAYQAWQIAASGPVSLGIAPDGGSIGFSADLSQAKAVAVTNEPAGGSPQPTSDPLVVAQLP